jgi:hypothetical protein
MFISTQVFAANRICQENFEKIAVGVLPEINPTNEISSVARAFWGNALGDVGGVYDGIGNPGKAAKAHVGPYTNNSSYDEPKFRFDNKFNNSKEIYVKFDVRVDSNLGTSNANREIYNFKFIKITDYTSAPTTTPPGYFSGNINLEPSDSSYSWYASATDEYYMNRATTRLENHLMDNKWHTYEIYIHIGENVVVDKYDESADGIIRVWEDGVLILEDISVPMRTSSVPFSGINSIAFIRHAKSLGAPVSGMDGYIYFDNIEVWDGMPIEEPSALATPSNLFIQPVK